MILSRMTIYRVLRLVSPSLRRRLIAGVFLRIMSNSLDLLALVGVGIIAVSLGGFAGPSHSLTPISLPGLGSFTLTQTSAAILAMVVGILFIAKSALAIALSSRLGRLIVRIESEVTSQALSSIFSKMSSVGFARMTVPETQNAVVMSANALTVSLLTAVVTISAEGTLLLVLLLSFLAVNPVACVSLVAYLGVVVFSLSKYVSKRIASETKAGFEAANATLTGIRDLQGVRDEVFVYGIATDWLKRIENAKEAYSAAAVRSVFLAGLPRYFIETALILGVFSLMGFIVLFSDLATQAVTLGVFLTGGLRLVASVLPLQSAWNSYRQASVLGAAALEVISKSPSARTEQAEVALHTRGINPEVALRLTNLSLSLPDGTCLLSEVTLEVKRNTKVAIVGPSGAGKSTLLRVLLGVQEVTSGSVEYFSASSGDPVIAFVPQRPELIAGTLFENVTLSDTRSAYTHDQVEKALRNAGLSHILDRDSTMLGRQIDPDLSLLSGGEVQRLGIARALLRDPDFLFFDEATSALDAQTEAEVTNYIDNLKEHRTLVVIAHRLSTIANADQIIYLDRGRVIGIGTFAELCVALESFRDAVEKLGISGTPAQEGQSEDFS